MKKTLLKLMLAALIVAGCISCTENGQKFRLEGAIEGLEQDDTLLLIDALTEDTVAMVPVVGGKITPVEGNVAEAVYAVLVNRDRTAGLQPIFLEEGTISVEGNINGMLLTKQIGTPLNNEADSLFKDIMAINDEFASQENPDFDEFLQKLGSKTSAAIRKHKDDPLGYFLLTQFNDGIEVDEMQELIALMEPKYGTNENFQAIKESYEIKAATDEGEMFADFEATYEGKTTKLSDYVGKGQYVLVDFWASWCGPCRQEIPNLIAAYNKYKGKGLVVLGVATWDKPEDTLKAIDELKIPYPQMMNAQDAGSKAYGIEGIPQIILFGPDGTIVARDLRGDAIEEKLAEIYK
ncbi:MAG: TlpA disulfide reductase family protein [Bacteroidales bacterium]|nr:TlpA disulfide reductase family protein [Bacteroidales bacterium]